MPVESLRAALEAALADTVARSSAYRPAVAAYLYERGLVPLYGALAGQGEVDAALIEGVWRLMLDSVATRRFGVSSDAWRAADDYPDRYFALLWLDILPAALPACAADRRLALAATLFNLGENLPPQARRAANGIAWRLHDQAKALAAAPEAVIEQALIAEGLIAGRATPARWQRIAGLTVLDLSAHDADFVPTAIAALDEGRFVVLDGRRAVALGLALVGDRLECTGPTPPPALDARRDATLGAVRVRLDDRQLRWQAGDETRLLGEIEAIAPAAIAADASGAVVLVDAASTHLQVLRMGA
ncbi:MAG: hypothetical protein KC620_07235 [Myxococcales bacterium]|nr:hypothetical protein [Myxococcales bacterium]